MLSGFVDPAEGSVQAFGEDLLAMAHYRRARWGLRRTFQTEQAIEELSVAGNVALAHEHSKQGDRAVAPRGRAAARSSFVGLDVDPDAQVGTLGARERRLVEVARAVVGKPKLVLLDEPGAGLPDEETEHLGRVIQRIPEHMGALVILVDHDMSLVSACCEVTAVLDFGKLIAVGPDGGGAARRGRHEGLPRHRGRRGHRSRWRDASSTLEDFTVARNGRPVVRDVNLSIPAGRGDRAARPERRRQVEPGARRRGRAARPRPARSSSTTRDLTGRRPEKIRQAGVAVVPEGRRLLSELTVEDNLAVACYALSREDASGRAASGRSSCSPSCSSASTRRRARCRAASSRCSCSRRRSSRSPSSMLIDELSLGLAPVSSSA